MPLLIEAVDGLYCPILRCDWCGKRISRADEGLLAWQMQRDWVAPATGEAHFTHKACANVFERVKGGRWFSAELIAFPIQVAANLGLDWERGEDVQQALRVAQAHAIHEAAGGGASV